MAGRPVRMSITRWQKRDWKAMTPLSCLDSWWANVNIYIQVVYFFCAYLAETMSKYEISHSVPSFVYKISLRTWLDWRRLQQIIQVSVASFLSGSFRTVSIGFILSAFTHSGSSCDLYVCENHWCTILWRSSCWVLIRLKTRSVSAARLRWKYVCLGVL